MSGDHILDHDRAARTGLPETIYCEYKTPEQIANILQSCAARGMPALLTRLGAEKHISLKPLLPVDALFDYHALSRTAFYGAVPSLHGSDAPAPIMLVLGGTSDLPVAGEVERTLQFHGARYERHTDVGVAGLHRLMAILPRLRQARVIIVLAGMEGAIFSVLAGLVPGAVIALPTSVGYGVSAGGITALHSALGSCAPGITAVNIDNGYGAACAALRILGAGRNTA